MVKYLTASLIVIALLAVAAPAQAAPSSGPSKWFYGGGLALSFGDVDFVSISPLVGYRITPVVSVGGGLQYFYRSYSQFGQDFSTNDYGAYVFSRFFLGPGFFLSASYEYMRFQYFDFNANRVNDTFGSFFVGGGFAQPMSRNSSFIVSALYNLSYKDDEPSPYGSPWVISAGVSVGF